MNNAILLNPLITVLLVDVLTSSTNNKMLSSLSGSMSEKYLFNLSMAVAGEAVLPVSCCKGCVATCFKNIYRFKIYLHTHIMMQNTHAQHKIKIT